MKQEAYKILKKAVSEHRDQMVSCRQICLGLLKDYGGREHPEVNLFADAVEANIPDRLLRSQPVTRQIIASLVENFISSKSCGPQDSEFAVMSWADALGLYTLDPSILTTVRASPDQGNRKGENAKVGEKTWHYQDGGASVGPVGEAQMVMLFQSGSLDSSSKVWSRGMSKWESASAHFPLRIHGQPPSRAPHTPKSIAPKAVTQKVYSPILNPGNHRISKIAYNGIRRMPYILGVALLGIFGAVMQAVLQSSGEASVAFTIIVGIGSLVLGCMRICNIGGKWWWILLLLIPILNLFVSLALVLCQEGYAETRKFDRGAIVAIWILIVFLVLGLVISTFGS